MRRMVEEGKRRWKNSLAEPLRPRRLLVPQANSHYLNCQANTLHSITAFFLFSLSRDRLLLLSNQIQTDNASFPAVHPFQLFFPVCDVTLLVCFHSTKLNFWKTQQSRVDGCFNSVTNHNRCVTDRCPHTRRVLYPVLKEQRSIRSVFFSPLMMTFLGKTRKETQ